MRIRLTQGRVVNATRAQAGDVLSVPDGTGRLFVSQGWAVDTDAEPQPIEQERDINERRTRRLK
jgi:hypothetical protein